MPSNSPTDPMALLRNTCLLSFGLCALAFLSVQAQSPVDNVCLGCICEASTNCNRTLECIGEVCGLFGITHAYWIDAGRPILANDDPKDIEAYKRCTIDPYCAGNTVQGYMTKYGKDCNSDGAISCYDFAALHRLGGYGCTGNMDFKFQNTLNNCLQAVASLNG